VPRTALFACLLLLALAAAPAGGAAPPVRYGVINSSWGHDPWQDEPNALAVSAGARWIREEVPWSAVQPRRGQWQWASADRTMLAAARHRITVVLLLGGSPRWAAASENSFPRKPADYAAFVAAAARRYGPGGSLWRTHPELPARPATFELWNEPYTDASSGGHADVDAYAALARAGALAGRAANPRARFLLAADIAAENGLDGWVDGLVRDIPELKELFGGFAIHPYGRGAPDARSKDPYKARWEVTRLERIRAQIVAHGLGRLHFWITEIGWPTCPAPGANCVSEATQAKYLQRFGQMVEGPWRSFVDAVFVYRLQEWNPRRADDSEQWFGLARPDGSHKPAWAVFRALSRLRG
jgi:hypothetical protein